jgi:hypothetical protein
MKKYKLSPFEELQLEKKRLKEECIISGQRLSYQVQYLSDNWGTLLTKGVVNSLKNRFMTTAENLSSKNTMTPSTNPFGFGMKGLFSSGLSGMANAAAISGFTQVGSIAWKIAKPLLISMVTRKVSSLLFGKSKRKGLKR